MDRAVFLEVLKDSYSAYYNIFPAEESEAPLSFRAEYIRRDERYWLTKNIKIWANETNEFAYVFSAESYDVETVKRCIDMALDEALPKVKPHKEHQYTNVKVVFIADSLDKDVARYIKKRSFSKNYHFSLWGYTELLSGVVDLSERSVVTNRAGHELAQFFGKLFAVRE